MEGEERGEEAAGLPQETQEHGWCRWMEKMRCLCTAQGQNGRFCHISKGMSLELLKVDYSKVGIRQ